MLQLNNPNNEHRKKKRKKEKPGAKKVERDPNLVLDLQLKKVPGSNQTMITTSYKQKKKRKQTTRERLVDVILSNIPYYNPWDVLSDEERDLLYQDVMAEQLRPKKSYRGNWREVRFDYFLEEYERLSDKKLGLTEEQIMQEMEHIIKPFEDPEFEEIFLGKRIYDSSQKNPNPTIVDLVSDDEGITVVTPTPQLMEYEDEINHEIIDSHIDELTSKQFQPASELENQNIILNTNNKMAKRGPKPGGVRKPRMFRNECPIGCQGYTSKRHREARTKMRDHMKAQRASLRALAKMGRDAKRQIRSSNAQARKNYFAARDAAIPGLAEMDKIGKRRARMGYARQQRRNANAPLPIVAEPL